MTDNRYRVGIVGLQPGRSWAARAHVPALRALSDLFEIVGVANTSLASAETAALESGIPRAFANVDELIASPDVDIVVVTVKVPPHFEIVKKAIKAGKHVFCEWPLGNGLAEAEEMAALAHEAGVLGVVGTQALVAPEIEYLRKLITDGFIGEVLSTSIVARGGGWGGIVVDKKISAYLLDRQNGATMLTIPVGHTLAALRHIFGEVAEVSSVLAVRRPTAVALDTGETLPVTAPDQVLVSGTFASGVPVCIHYRGGSARNGDGLFWEVNGTEGDIRISGASGHTQMVQLSLEAAVGEEKTFRPLAVPESYRTGYPEDVEPGNVARLYSKMANDLRHGTRTAPNFDDAVAVHRIIQAIETAAETGKRTSPIESDERLARPDQPSKSVKKAAVTAASRTELFRQEIPGSDSQEAALFLLELPPGGAAPAHKHPGIGVGYVLEGVYESQYEGEELKTFTEGQALYDLAETPHLIARNGSADRPLRFLMTFVIEKGGATSLPLP